MTGTVNLVGIENFMTTVGSRYVIASFHFKNQQKSTKTMSYGSLFVILPCQIYQLWSFYPKKKKNIFLSYTFRWKSFLLERKSQFQNGRYEEKEKGLNNTCNDADILKQGKAKLYYFYTCTVNKPFLAFFHVYWKIKTSEGTNTYQIKVKCIFVSEMQIFKLKIENMRKHNENIFNVIIIAEVSCTHFLWMELFLRNNVIRVKYSYAIVLFHFHIP